MTQTTRGNKTLAEMILRALQGKPMRQSELARIVGVNRSTVTAWVRRNVVPSPRQRDLLAGALELDREAVESAAVRAKGGGRPARRILSGHAVAVHPALADALDGLSWEAQEALAKALTALRETKPQEFRGPSALTRGRIPADNANVRSSYERHEAQGDDDEKERRWPEGTRPRE